MTRGLSLSAGVCCPLLLAGMIVSLRSYWRATEAALPIGASVYRITADEAGISFSRFPIAKPQAALPIPRTFDLSGRVQFFLRRSRAPMKAELLHIPYWFFWATVTPPILAWLLEKKRIRQRALRKLDHLCIACGYDLRATPFKCPECGTDVSQTEPARRDALVD